MKMEEYTESANFYLKHRKKTWQLQGTKKKESELLTWQQLSSNIQ